MLAPPIASISTPSPYYIVNSQLTQIRCSSNVSTNETRAVWSRKDGSPLGNNVQQNDGTLIINGARSENDGTYLCNLTNIAGSDSSDVAIVVVCKY